MTLDELLERDDLHTLPEAQLADLVQPFIQDAMRPDFELQEAIRKKSLKGLTDALSHFQQTNDTSSLVAALMKGAKRK